ncbi:hypothetical protein GO755_34880 [Spirosoma sp. HMF4905]|uniref:Uncharacterized protein n=1 Tax=Spirosoma arboris TaxID=2682092 RepID=A0A7K1SN87_9BACT|nr:hypothetical protein [Spirosoma arboris]MVM35259.1 hypothetical protein [Spirosoma arboris]
MDNLLAEQAELNALIEKGAFFTTPKQSLLRFWGSEERRFTIKPFFLGTIDRLGAEFFDMGFSEAAIDADPFGESKRLASQNAKRCARVVAIAILNRKWPIKFLTPFLANYLLWRVTPNKLWQLTLIINQMMNLGDFTNSIRYLQVTRTTAPALVEEKPENQESDDENSED